MTFVNPSTPEATTAHAKAQKYDVIRRGPDGQEIVTVSAESGDEAASKAYKVGTIIVGVTPASGPEQVIERPRPLTLQGNPDGSSAAVVEARTKAETQLQPQNAADVKAQGDLDGVTTNAVGDTGPGPSGKPSHDLPEAKPAKAAPPAKGK